MDADYQQERPPIDLENLKYYLAGFTDGEGSFSVSIHRSKFVRLGWNINPLFQVYQHKDNSRILYIFKDVFKCGNVSKKGGNPSCFVYCVSSMHDLMGVVIPFFDRYPLVGEKYQNFLLFKQIVHGVSLKKHLTKNGFRELARLAFQMNHSGKYRKNSLQTIFSSLEESSETTRRGPGITPGHDIVRAL